MHIKPTATLPHYIRWTLFSLICGIFSALAASFFLVVLNWATNTRELNPSIIWALPLVGFFIGWIYHQFGKNIAAGNNLIIDEIHNPQKIIPLRMAPFILVGTVLTHLFGGSAGREGTAVQMGASLADQISHFFKVNAEERKILLAAGAGAGFGAAIGAPWAGMIFGMEVIYVGKLRLFAWFECFIASFTAYYLATFIGAPHTYYPPVSIPNFDFQILLFVAIAGIPFGIAAMLFTMFAHFIEKTQGKFISYPPLKPLIGGLLLICFFYLEGSYRYTGLGIPIIQEALSTPSKFYDPIWKTFFTALTVGSGFKGGEFIPLVFIGTTLGSALGFFLHVSFSLLAALGFAAVFGAAANTPIACTLMAMEIFGWKIGPYAFIACFTAYYFSGHHGIYRSQKIHEKKHEKILRYLSWLGELPKRFFNSKN